MSADRPIDIAPLDGYTPGVFVHPRYARDPREVDPSLDEWDHGRAAAIRAAIDNIKTENGRRRARR